MGKQIKSKNLRLKETEVREMFIFSMVYEDVP